MLRAVAIAVGAAVLLGGTAAVVAMGGIPLAAAESATTTDENASPYHAHPDEHEAEGDLEAVRAWLERWMGDRLSESISEDDADRARDLLGEEYAERLGQYLEVTEETDDDAHDADVYEEAREDHARFVDLVAEYEAAMAAYDAAVARGDEAAAERHAHEVNRLAAEIEELSERILERVDVVGLSPDAVADVEDARDRTSADRDRVRDEQFVETELDLEWVDEPASFIDPAEIAGRVSTADGEPIANETVTFQVRDRTVTTETDGGGNISFAYRPVDLPVGLEPVEVVYAADPASGHLNATDVVHIRIEQVEPTLTLDVDAERVAFGDEIAFEGTLAVDGHDVEGAVLEVYLGDHHAGTVTTEAGAFEGNLTVPADVPSGDVPLQLRLDGADRALAETTAVHGVEVVETPTRLEVEATLHEGDTVEVAGALATEGGDPIANQTVTVGVAAGESRHLETDADGGFSGQFAIEDEAPDTVEVVAAFNATGTNLGASEEAIVLGQSPLGSLAPWIALGLAGIGLLLIAGGTWLPLRRIRGASTAEPSIESPPSTPQAPADPERESPGVEALLAAATDRYRGDAFDDAVVIGYAALRAHLATHLEDGDGATHWEFLAACRANPPDRFVATEGIGHLEMVTATYERAAFTDRGVSDAEAWWTIESVGHLTDRRPPAGAGVEAD